MPYMNGQKFHDKAISLVLLVYCKKSLQPIVVELEYCHSKRANHPLIAMGQLTIWNVQLLASRELSSVPVPHNPWSLICTLAKATSQNGTWLSYSLIHQ